VLHKRGTVLDVVMPVSRMLLGASLLGGALFILGCFPKPISLVCAECSENSQCAETGLSCVAGRCQGEVSRCTQPSGDAGLSPDGGSEVTADGGTIFSLHLVGDAKGVLNLRDSGCAEFLIEAGNGPDGNRDSFMFYGANQTEAFSLTATMVQKDARVAGVMMRESLNADARLFGVYVQSGTKNYLSGFRMQTGDGLQVVDSAELKGAEPFVFGVKRSGSTFSSFAMRPDGGVLMLRSETIAMGASVWGGLFVAAPGPTGALFCGISVQPK
jgi:hypothetical protein